MSFATANKAHRERCFGKAMLAYVETLSDSPGLESILLSNIRRSSTDFQSLVENRAFARISVSGWSLTHNAAGRAYALGQLHSELAQAEIIGSLIPKYGDGLWEPLRSIDIPVHSFISDDPSRFMSQALALVSAHPYHLVHLSKPRLPNIILGMLYKLLWGSQVLVDVDDNEIAFVSGGLFGEPDLDLGSLGCLPAVEQLYGNRWTEIAVKLSCLFDEITVSNPVLQAWHGGTIVRHVRSETDFDPARFDRAALRKEYELSQDDRVVLFLGTPRAHKCLLEAGRAIEALGRPDVTFLIVGTFGDNEQELLGQLKALKGLKARFLPNQPFSSAPELVALADVCLALQHPSSGITEAQVPAKLSDALAMGKLPIVTDSPALADLALDGLALRSNIKDLPQVLAEALEDRWHSPEMARARREYFLAEFSLAAGRVQLQRALDQVEDGDNRQLDQFMRLLLPHFPGFPKALLELRPLERLLPAEAGVAERRLREILAADCPDGLDDVLELGRVGLEQAGERLQTHEARPLVSVIMPTHNRASIIAEAIQSVVEQDYSDWELWVCDDGSTDVTLDVVCQFADTRIHYLPLDKGGAAAARNEGLSRARGEIIAYLDSDNLWRKEFLTRMVCALLDRPGHLCAFGGYLDYRVKQDGKIRVKAFERPRFDHERLLGKNYIDLNSFVHWREAYESFGGFTESLSRRQDYDLILKYTWLRDPIQVDEIVTLYQRHDSLEQLTVSKKQDRSPNEIIAANIDRYFKDGLPLPTRRAVQRVTVLSWDMSRNHFSKAFAVAEALSADYDVQLVSFRFFEEAIFPPLKNIRPDFETVYIQGSNFPDFFAAMRRALSLIDGELLYVVKPRLPSLGLALLANALKGVPLVLEINDLETVVQAPASGQVSQALDLDAVDLQDPELLNPYSDLWSQLMEPLARELPVLVTHNTAIDAHFDHRCLYMRNLKDERVYDPDRYDRDAIRADLGFDVQDRVILFGGLIRRHKGIYELVELVDRLEDARYKLLFVGSRISPDQKQLVEAHGNRLIVLPPQDRAAMARINLAADLVILWLDPDVAASHYQMPYKATDALAMGTPIIANDISDLGILADQSYLVEVPFGDWDAMLHRVRALFEKPVSRDRIREAGRRLFKRQFSYAAGRASFELAARRVQGIAADGWAPGRRFAEFFNEFCALHSPDHTDFLDIEELEGVAGSSERSRGKTQVQDEFTESPGEDRADANIVVLVSSRSRGQGLQAARRLHLRAGSSMKAIVVHGDGARLLDFLQKLVLEKRARYFVVTGDRVYPGMDWLRIGEQTLEAFGRGMLPLNTGQNAGQPGSFAIFRSDWLTTVIGRLNAAEVRTPEQLLASLWQMAQPSAQTAWNGDAVVYDLAPVVASERGSLTTTADRQFLVRPKRGLWRRLLGAAQPARVESETPLSRDHSADEQIRVLDADQLLARDTGVGSEVAVLMPSIDFDRAWATARHLVDRAGMPAELFILIDRTRQGFVSTINQAAARLQSRYIVYLAEDAVAGEGWLKTAFEQLETSGKGLLAFNCGKWRGRLAAFGMVRTEWARSVYGRRLFYSGYRAHRADNELTVIARAQDQFIYCPDALLLENDPSKLQIGAVEQAASRADRRLFRERYQSGFDGLVSSSILKALADDYIATDRLSGAEPGSTKDS